MRFGGIGRLYGVAALERLSNAHVCVCGIGGVGTWVVEALVRSGVGELTLIDLDDICVTNTNRQLHALHDTVGLQKADVMAARARAINPEVIVHAVQDFIMADTIDALIDDRFDVVVDAIDDLKNKCMLIAHCHTREIKIVTVGGAGGRRDPTKIAVDDLVASRNDGLLRNVRRILRREYGFGADDTPWGVPCVYSSEQAYFPSADGGVCRTPERGTSLTLDCNSGFGTASFVTGTFGFAAASAVMDVLLEDVPTARVR